MERGDILLLRLFCDMGPVVRHLEITNVPGSRPDLGQIWPRRLSKTQGYGEDFGVSVSASLTCD